MISLVTGFVAGLLHVFSGPDHLAAVAPLAVDGRSRAWISGLKWGAGHASGVVMVGLLSLLLREVLPIDLISSWSERLVGVVLIGIGLWGLRRAFTPRVHAHAHSHDGHTHVHVHVHAAKVVHSHAGDGAHTHTHAAFAIGTLHGLAGSSHFLGVLPSLAFPSTTGAVSYLAAYGAGTIGAMLAFSSVVGLIARHFDVRGCAGLSKFDGGVFWGGAGYRGLLAGRVRRAAQGGNERREASQQRFGKGDLKQISKKTCCQSPSFSLSIRSNAPFWCAGKLDLPNKRIETHKQTSQEEQE